MAEIPLSKPYDLEKSTSVDSANGTYQPVSALLKRKLIIVLIAEIICSLTIYFNYDNILYVNSLLAPTLLGASSAALAQSMNQYSKNKFSWNRIFKFMVWGCINGYFTVLWIEVLILQFDNIVYRIIVDQGIGAPTFQLIFSILNTLWDHGEIAPTFRGAFVKSLRYSYCFWPFFSILQFVLIPKAAMFPSNCLANLIWNIILSKIA